MTDDQSCSLFSSPLSLSLSPISCLAHLSFLEKWTTVNNSKQFSLALLQTVCCHTFVRFAGGPCVSLGNGAIRVGLGR